MMLLLGYCVVVTHIIPSMPTITSPSRRKSVHHAYWFPAICMTIVTIAWLWEQLRERQLAGEEYRKDLERARLNRSAYWDLQDLIRSRLEEIRLRCARPKRYADWSRDGF